MANTFIPRTEEPSEDNIYYRVTRVGGLNECIEIMGSGSALPNCVGYAWGRAYEIMGKRPTLSKADAEKWYGNTSDGYTRSQTARIGAIACWSKGSVTDDSDGAGHVAVVEQINVDGSIVTSNSDYSGRRFYTRTFTGIPTMTNYHFQGYIYLPIDVTPGGSDTPITPTTKNKKKNIFI